ncbi:MAG TPA: heat-inducible transcriptional repressor HrcA [Gaiellaceae bacterium]|nr:heat-inducible transcriptional repressor HrcA [Gaiellaceae bacterium]
MVSPGPDLTERQRHILVEVVEEYVATGQPVGSKHLIERTGMRVSSATVRGELAELERFGLLTHPHTSAGRVPTDRGYRYYVDRLLERPAPRPATFPLDLTEARSEVESALQATTEMLSQVTRLIALVSAPPLQTATVRHVEVLLLQPQVVMVVVITSSGGVTKRAYAFDAPVDPGLVHWAGQYLNDQVVGLSLGTGQLRRRLLDAGVARAEGAFLEVLAPAFVEAEDDEQRVFVGGAAGMLDGVRDEELGTYRSLIDLLERRRTLLDLLAEALDPRRPFVRVGDELATPGVRDLALVGAAYGIANRTLGAVSLIGPSRMDYDKAIRTVRSAASELSRFAEVIYGDN